MNILGTVLSAVIEVCFKFVGSYGLAIILFTLMIKVILFPVSIWTHRNSLKMVGMTPELNRLKIKYYGDKDTIAEETQKLYKRERYHPLASVIPMLIQLLLLIGVIGAVRELLAGTESALSAYPTQRGGITLLLPLAAGCSALALGLAQNRLNPLQREQTKAGQWMTNGLSIAISLALGAFVPIGVGIYWIASNLLTIIQQMALNLVMRPEKYVDYAILRESQRELAELDSLSVHVSKEDKRREKADYKRFFSIANKHLVFYSEKSGFYKYFQDVIEYLLSHSNITIHYVTSDPRDQIFTIAERESRIRPYYIGERKLITLMMKMDADMVVMTMPDLDNYHIKRSYVRKDIEYVYMFHGVISGMRTLRPGALDHFDTLLTVGGYHEKEIRLLEEVNHTPAKKLVPCGYGVIEDMARAYAKMDRRERERPKILIAPSWQEGNILENGLLPLVKGLLAQGFDVTVRPHPQYIKRFPSKFEAIAQSCASFPAEQFQIERDFSSNLTVFTADLLVTDWSSIGYEYALATLKPALFINTPMKVVNPQCVELNREETRFDLEMRRVMGAAIEPEAIEKEAGSIAARLLAESEKYAARIENVRKEHIYHFGESGKYGGQYILGVLTKKSQ